MVIGERTALIRMASTDVHIGDVTVDKTRRRRRDVMASILHSHRLGATPRNPKAAVFAWR
jgi:hypothetical protein